MTHSSFQNTWLEWHHQKREFDLWQKQGIQLTDIGSCCLDPSSYRLEKDPYSPGSYHSQNFYTGGSFWVGKVTSLIESSSFAFEEAIISWQADTPTGTWIELRIRAENKFHWTTWYNLGVWAADTSTIKRHSVNQQLDPDGKVSVDTLSLQKPAHAYQIQVRLFTVDPHITPELKRITLALSKAVLTHTDPDPGSPELWNRCLSVPQYSQMIYPQGGGWCSPTSLAMVIAYWQKKSDPGEQTVKDCVAGVYDWLYNGYGNWPFNVAYAASQGLEGTVARLTQLAECEPWIAAGVPVIISFGWQDGELHGSAIPKSNGHLAVLIGFDPEGNPIVNDPAAAQNNQVKRIYLRQELEPLWLTYSGGTVYFIYPPNWPLT